MPQLALAVVGAELGATALGATAFTVGSFAVSGASVGFFAGSVIGSALFSPTQKSQGPRLADLKAGQFTYGSVIPYIEGHPRVGGIVIWASAKREIATTTSQGKGGGGESTTFAYEQDVFFMLAENVLPALRRVWLNGNLVWTAGQTSTDAWDSLTFYSGGPSQLPDPIYEAAVGVGNAPAYRTRTTVMLGGVKLGTSGQLANFTFEVGPDPTIIRPGTVISLFNFTDPADTLVLPPYTSTGGGHVGASASINDQSELSVPNAWGLFGHENALSGIDASGLFLEEYQHSATFSNTVFQANEAWTIAGDFTIEFRINPLGQVWAGAGGDYFILSSVADGTTVPDVSGQFQLKKATAGGVQQLQFTYLDGATLHTVTSGSTGLPVNALSEVSVERRATTLLMFMAGVQVGSVSCGTADLVVTVLNLGGRNGGNHYVPNDFASGRYTGLRITSGLARYTGSYATGQAWTLDGTSIDTSVYGAEPTMQDVVERQCLRAGLTSDQFDASALGTRNLHAMAISQQSSPRSIIEMLMAAYAFYAVESDKIYFRWRGQASVATIPWTDLVMTGQDATPLPITKANDIELPVQVFVKYSNLDDDFQDGSESSDRMISSGQNTVQVEFPLGLRPTEAKRIADFQVTDAAASNFSFGSFSLDRSYSALEPGDVIEAVAQDAVTVFTMRMTKKNEAGGILTFDAVSDDATVLASVLHTDTSGATNSTVVAPPVDTLLALMDCPLLADADDGPGFYADVKAATDVSFPGAVLFESDDDVTFASVGSGTQEGVFGTAETALGSGPLGQFDEGHVVTVDVGFGQLASSTRDVLLAGDTNLMLLGSEVIQFRSAALISPGVYTLSGLRRGLRGTEWAIGTHVIGEQAVLLDGAVKHAVLSNADLGVGKFYKAVTMGRTTASAVGQGFTANGVSLKPFAPDDVRVARDASANITITMHRRSRLACRLAGALGISIPLGEESERYECDVFATSGYATVKRTLTASSSAAGGLVSFSYSATDQTTDFSGTQATVYLKAYQLSAAVGRGYANTAQG
jgi:hypothetical protein